MIVRAGFAATALRVSIHLRSSAAGVSLMMRAASELSFAACGSRFRGGPLRTARPTRPSGPRGRPGKVRSRLCKSRFLQAYIHACFMIEADSNIHSCLLHDRSRLLQSNIHFAAVFKIYSRPYRAKEEVRTLLSPQKEYSAETDHLARAP